MTLKTAYQTQALSSAIILAGMCLAAGQLTAASSNNAEEQWTIRGHVAPEKFVIQSHRGAGELAPENTVGAFVLGWKLGTVPEADLRTTRDGVIVAFHDANFKRTVRGATPALQKKGVADISYAELSKLDVGGWMGSEFSGRRVSRISEVFELMTGKPERKLYLDIKNVSLPQLATEVRTAKVSGQVVLASTTNEVIREWKRLVPDSQTLLWMGGSEADLARRIDQLKRENFAGVTQLQLHVRVNTNSATDSTPAEPFNLSRTFIRSVGAELRLRGILFQCLPWGVSDPKVYWQLLDLGVASFATDHPDVTLKAVRDYCAGDSLKP